jgi:hypothetical protein
MKKPTSITPKTRTDLAGKWWNYMDMWRVLREVLLEVSWAAEQVLLLRRRV